MCAALSHQMTSWNLYQQHVDIWIVFTHKMWCIPFTAHKLSVRNAQVNWEMQTPKEIDQHFRALGDIVS